ncbi:MAG TPA: vWA domain-containing protein [Acidobacteriaceae bacterium]|nr:vWA domain-containing protein [Acidobacteriaceae bacterium]
MRSRKTVSHCVASLLLLLVLVPGAWAAHKQRVIILALDQSASMVHSDPTRLRVEAAGLLAAVAGAQDQIGVIGFGDTSTWLQTPVERDRFNFKLLDSIGSTDRHTAFAPVLKAVYQYLTAQPASFLQDNQVSLVLLTDGRSDPADILPDADRSAALSIGSDNAAKLKIYTIGLGNALDENFLNQLARTSNGLSIQAASAGDLPDAFLRVAARVAALPVYARNSSPQPLQWAGKPRRVMAVFTGDHASSAQLEGRVVYRSAHVAVAEEEPSQGSAKLEWAGHGFAFLCVQEPLRFSSETEFPSAMLTDARHPLMFTLQSEHGQLKKAFFLQEAIGHLTLTGPDNQSIPLHQRGGSGQFTGELEAKSSGTFRARASLDSPYGKIETFLGDLTVSVLPVAIPQQVSAGVFDPLPRTWFQKKLTVLSTLPMGTVNLRFVPKRAIAQNSRDRLKSELSIAPGQKPILKVLLRGPVGQVHVVNYTANWSDGETDLTRRGTLRILVRQMSPAELLRHKWPWFAMLVLLVCTTGTIVFKFWPRPLQADLIVRQNGTQVLRLQLPSQLRTRMLHVSESEAGQSTGSSTAVIAGPKSRDLLSLESVRRRGRWTIIAHPRAALVPTQHGRKWTEIDLRAFHVPVFSTEDGTIQINVLYS